MSGMDDFRFRSHELLVELDATTNKMMMLVISKQVSGTEWDKAVKAHRDAFQAWNTFVNSGH
ncbi:hypothetical protein MJP36_17785 [Pseudomonas palleroniana]|uniref:hypothetical protein n=1 Tax=Pseudomonas palleroniana TaxID=191390 RepID=UPI001FCAB8DE|nr:hypothetical protein [Pseudomonas palleroniana]UOK36358.1 hypothetical protein MJP36_17785 [Pseudomonas palleroniana]